jgi:cytosine/uracil/thiamine/allantoin permease
MTTVARYVGGLCIAAMLLTIWLAPVEHPASFIALLALIVCFLICVAIVVVGSAKDGGLLR